MVFQEGVIFGVSIFIFIVLLMVVQAESKRGRRFFAARIRGWLDERVMSIEKWFVDKYNHFVRYIVQLHWYYSIHSVLRAVLRVLVAFYTYFENLFERNRFKTKQLRVEKRQLGELNHLRQMAEHKEDTALSAAEKRKLRKTKLEEKH